VAKADVGTRPPQTPDAVSTDRRAGNQDGMNDRVIISAAPDVPGCALGLPVNQWRIQVNKHENSRGPGQPIY